MTLTAIQAIHQTSGMIIGRDRASQTPVHPLGGTMVQIETGLPTGTLAAPEGKRVNGPIPKIRPRVTVGRERTTGRYRLTMNKVSQKKTLTKKTSLLMSHH